MKLTPLQKLFVEAYVSDANFNATKAYKLAGFKHVNATKRAYELINLPHVASAIENRIETKRKTFRVREDEILEGLYTEAKREGKGSSQTGRIQAWVWLGKHLGMFREKEEKKDTNIVVGIVNYDKKDEGEKEKEIVEVVKTISPKQVKESLSLQ